MAVHQLPLRRPLLLDPRAMLERPARVGRRLWDRARRASHLVRARAGYSGGVAMACWGVGVQFGLGWALMAGGLVMSMSFLLLYPVDGSP